MGSTRVWWMLYYIGFKNVSILNGGFEEWNRLCFPIATGENKFEYADFNVVPKRNLFIEKDKRDSGQLSHRKMLIRLLRLI